MDMESLRRKVRNGKEKVVLQTAEFNVGKCLETR